MGWNTGWLLSRLARPWLLSCWWPPGYGWPGRPSCGCVPWRPCSPCTVKGGWAQGIWRHCGLVWETEWNCRRVYMLLVNVKVFWLWKSILTIKGIMFHSQKFCFANIPQWTLSVKVSLNFWLVVLQLLLFCFSEAKAWLLAFVKLAHFAYYQ